MRVKSSKRCARMGSCYGAICQNLKTDQIVEEMSGEPANYAGFSYCAKSCGCASCGCFLCSSGCLFYQTYAKPLSDTVYELISCRIWEYEVIIVVHMIIQNENLQETFYLKVGISVEWKNMKLIIPSISIPPLPILGSQFLTDRDRTIIVKASSSGQPMSGTIGQLECSN